MLSIESIDLEQVKELASLGFTPEEISDYLDLDFHAVKEMLLDEKSAFRNNYKKGIQTTNFELRKMLREQALMGNMQSFNQFFSILDKQSSALNKL